MDRGENRAEAVHDAHEPPEIPDIKDDPSGQDDRALTRGRRERSMRAKQERIHAAARDLFALKGYSTVTTQEIADRADVAQGTLFRYAASKAEMLLMVYNDELRRITGQATAPAPGPTEQIMQLFTPLITLAMQQHENTLVYQREILFGDASGQHHGQGMALLQQLEAAIVQVLLKGPAPASAELAARCIFATLHLELVRTGLGQQLPQRLPSLLRAEIELMVAPNLG